MKESVSLVAKGFCMGSADLVPGVSGGTMALILGIYTRLLEAIKSFDKEWLLCLFRFNISCLVQRPHFNFLIPLVIGIACALVVFTKIIPLPVLIQTHPELVYGLFFGLILASIVILMKEVRDFKFIDTLYVIAGTVMGLVIVNLVPTNTPDGAWFIFICGAVAISAMILPGISGSFILLMLRKYAYIIGALGELNFSILIPFVLGMITGLVVFTRFLVWLLHHYYKQTLLVIKGILIGSLWMIWPFQDRVFETIRNKDRLVSSTPVLPTALDMTFLNTMLLICAGFIVVMVLNRLASKQH